MGKVKEYYHDEICEGKMNPIYEKTRPIRRRTKIFSSTNHESETEFQDRMDEWLNDLPLDTNIISMAVDETTYNDGPMGRCWSTTIIFYYEE
jgi:hypothetical protein